MNKYPLVILGFFLFTFSIHSQVITGGKPHGPHSDMQEFMMADAELAGQFRLCFNKNAEINNLKDIHVIVKLSKYVSALSKDQKSLACPEVNCLKNLQTSKAIKKFFKRQNIDEEMSSSYGITLEQARSIRKDIEQWMSEN